MCEPIRELVSLALDGEIGRRGLLRLRGHLLVCRDCACYRRQLVTVATTLRESAPELARGVAFPRPSRSALLARKSLALGAAAALMLIGFAGLAGEQSGPSRGGALSAAQGMPVYGGLRPDQGYPIYVYREIVLPPL
jgi:predicted anti-sigma-YlaC factor YlaD